MTKSVPGLSEAEQVWTSTTATTSTTTTTTATTTTTTTVGQAGPDAGLTSTAVRRVLERMRRTALPHQRPVRSPWAPWLGLTAALLGGCDRCSTPSDGAASRSGSGADGGREATGSAPSALPTRLDAQRRAQWAELVGREPPPTLADAKEARFYARCLEFTRALHERAAVLAGRSAHQSRSPDEPPALLEAIEQVRAAPPPIPPEDVSWCAAYTVDSLRAELGTIVAQQAETTLQAMAGAMVAAYQRDGKLCPSSTAPVPASLEDLEGGPFTPDVHAWDGPAWRCLRFRWLQPMRFQYELETEGARFVFIARGSPAADGRNDAYRLAGHIRDGEIELGRVTGRFLTATPKNAPTAEAP